MSATDSTAQWKPAEKFAFRFLFLFLGFFLLNYEVAMASLYYRFYKKLGKIYGWFDRPLHWLDQHLYHIGYDPNVHESMPGDNHFGAVWYVTAIIIFFIATIIWSILDRRRENYDKLYYWFRVYVRCMVAIIMFGYGMNKLFPSQMTYPNVEQLLTPIGNQGRFQTIWTMIGASPAYEMFTGLCEVIASLLLVFGRTYVFGCLFMCTVLCNVVALNIFYNIPVKMYSSLLLVCILFLLGSHMRKLFHFFFFGETETLSEKRFGFQPGRKKYVVITLTTIVPLLLFGDMVYKENKLYKKYHGYLQDQKLFEVTTFILKDTLAPLTTDTLRWKRFAIPYKNSVAIFDMQDNPTDYDCDVDTLHQLYRIHDNADSSKWDTLYYHPQQNKMMNLLGKWKGNNVNILLKEFAIDSMILNKDKITFLSD